jgi:hypothetical protein
MLVTTAIIDFLIIFLSGPVLGPELIGAAKYRSGQKGVEIGHRSLLLDLSLRSNKSDAWWKRCVGYRDSLDGQS